MLSFHEMLQGYIGDDWIILAYIGLCLFAIFIISTSFIKGLNLSKKQVTIIGAITAIILLSFLIVPAMFPETNITTKTEISVTKAQYVPDGKNYYQNKGSEKLHVLPAKQTTFHHRADITNPYVIKHVKKTHQTSPSNLHLNVPRKETIERSFDVYLPTK